jgi:hypothetical protein
MGYEGRAYYLTGGDPLAVSLAVIDDSTGTAKSLSGYEVEASVLYGGAEVSIGTADIIGSGAASRITFALSQSESAGASFGVYYVRLHIFPTATPAALEKVAEFTVQIDDPARALMPPASKANVLLMLGLDYSEVNNDQLDLAMTQARSAARSMMPADTLLWIRDHGWPAHIIILVEELCVLLMRQYLYDEDKATEISAKKEAIGSAAVDTTGDDINDTGGRSFHLRNVGFQAATFNSIDYAKENIR